MRTLHSLVALGPILALAGMIAFHEAHAAPEIVAAQADGHSLRLEAGDAAVRPTVVVPVNARGVAFRFRDATADGDDGRAAPGHVAARLKYRLEGVDAEWRDVGSSARVLIQFRDQAQRVIAGTTGAIKGESVGWTGALTTSRYHPASITAVAPAGVAAIEVAFHTFDDQSLVGCLGIDDVRVSIDRDGQRLASFALAPDDIPVAEVAPLATPAAWHRLGSRPDIARLLVRPEPTPHAMLAFVDDDSDHFGNWATNLPLTTAVEAGDQVTLSWSAAHSLGKGGEQNAGYGRLTPGTYWFRVAAFGPCGTATGAETGITVIVPRPWHRRGEFWAGAAAVAGCLAFVAGRSLAAFRLQRRLAALERAHAFERERSRIARDLHDELGAALSEIAMQAAGVAEDARHAGLPRTAAAADSITSSASELTRGVDAIVWAVNPANDTLERFASYVVQSAQQFLEAAGISVRFRVPADLPALCLDGAARHRVFLALREALHNAIQHAGAETVTISMALETTALEVVVEDDGRGFDIAMAPHAGHDGLANMRLRMAEIGGKCTVTSGPSGTRVVFQIPLEGLTTGREERRA